MLQLQTEAHALWHVPAAALQAGVDALLAVGGRTQRVELIVRRPAEGAREVVSAASLTQEAGLVGDGWLQRGSKRTEDGSAHPDMQLTVMDARVIALIAGTQERWPLAGDQLYVDFDLSEDSLPIGSRLAVGEAVIEVTEQPHTGCAKFIARFGVDAHKLVNSARGRALRLRGLNARVVKAGVVQAGDRISLGPPGA